MIGDVTFMEEPLKQEGDNTMQSRVFGFYYGVCQIEGSDVAFSRQIKGALSRKCAHPAHL